MSEPAPTLDERLRADLGSAIKRRDRTEIAVLRTLVSAVDNAGAVPIPAGASSLGVVGLSGDTPRRTLSEADVEEIVRSEAMDIQSAIDEFARVGRSEQVAELTVRFDLVQRYLT